MTIKMYENKEKKTFSFKVFMNKRAILYGKNFPSRSDCLERIEKMLTTLQSNSVINIRSEGTKGYAFTISKIESTSFKSLELASDGLAYLKEFVGTTDNFKVNFDTLKEKVVAKKRLVHKKPRFDLSQVSKTKKAGFELLDNLFTNLFYFHFNDAKGRPFLYSRAYDGKTRRTKAAKKIIKSLKQKQQLVTDIVAAKEGVFVVMKGPDGLEIVRSRLFKNRTKLDKALAYFKKEAKGTVKILKVPKKKKKKKNQKKKLPKEKYLLKQKAPFAEVGFEGFKSRKNKLHYFHYHDTKGNTLLFSQPYISRKIRDKAIQKAIQLSKDKRLYDLKKKGEQHYFVLVDKEGKGLARSRLFASQEAMVVGLRHFHTNARTYDEHNNVVKIPTTETIVIELNNEKTVPSNVEVEKKKKTPAPAEKIKPANLVANPTGIATNGIDKNNTGLTKRATNGRLPSAKTPISAKDSKKNILNKPKVTPVEKTKKPISTKTTPLKTIPEKAVPPKKKLPPLKEVEKTSRASTKIQQDRRAPIKDARNHILLNKTVDTEKNEPPRIPPRSEEKQPLINWWWLPVILIAALLLYGLFKLLSGFMLTENTVPPVEPVKKEIVKPLEKLPTLLGSTATELGFEKGSLSARITDFLSLPKSILPKTFLLDKVHFLSNQEILTEEAQGQLERIVQILKAYPTVNIQINGHTDNIGKSNSNLALSERRAITVKDYLKAKGIEAERVNAKGFGPNQPIESNEIAEGRQANRRSEIVLLKR